MLVLFRAVQGAISLEALPVSFSPTRHLRNEPGFAVDSDKLGFSDLSGNRNHDIHDSSIEQQKLMDFELVPALACLVHGCNKRNERAESWTELK
jgi:hypothetical protein